MTSESGLGINITYGNFLVLVKEKFKSRTYGHHATSPNSITRRRIVDLLWHGASPYAKSTKQRGALSLKQAGSFLRFTVTGLQ
ncbi:hypothetical protein [Paenibacillus validus]|uniref:hypothetical protein n=1 Tax=Paenibacillus validus TaxID=44253 RepID=UPI003D29CE90